MDMIEQILLTGNTMLLIEERANKSIVIGSPHHTPGGISEMPCPDHKAGDENAGLIARKLAERLDSCSIIAYNYTIDSNKELDTDYSKQVSSWKPKYLIEVHGHGAKKISDSCIEISSGKEEMNDISLSFANLLTTKLHDHEILKSYTICGDFKHLHFQASKTATITHDGWKAFHIELPPSIRKCDGNKLPSFIDIFILGLKETIDEICV